MPWRQAALMMLSPGSKGISRPSYLKVGIRIHSRGDSVIALAADHVQRAEGRDDVAQHGARDELAEALRDREAGRPDANAIGRAAAVRHEVEAELAVAAFGVRVDLA